MATTLIELLEKAGFTSLIQDENIVRDPDGNPVFVMSESKYAETDAALIVHCVNKFKQTVDALELAVAGFGGPKNGTVYPKLIAALAAAQTIR